MSELKTKKTKASVLKFLKSVEDEKRREDGLKLLKIFEEVTGEKAAMWGTSIVGFGQYHYKSTRSKQEGDWPLTGFSPRKQNMTIYIMPGFKHYEDLMKKIGKHKTSVSCLYFKRLSDLDEKVLRELIEKAVKYMREEYKHC